MRRPVDGGQPADSADHRQRATGYTGDGGVLAIINNEIVAVGITNGYLANFNVPEASSGTFKFQANVDGGGHGLPPGNYELSTTITCVAD